MLPPEYHAKACRLLRIAAARLYQDKVTSTNNSATNEEATICKQPVVTNRKHKVRSNHNGS